MKDRGDLRDHEKAEAELPAGDPEVFGGSLVAGGDDARQNENGHVDAEDRDADRAERHDLEMARRRAQSRRPV